MEKLKVFLRRLTRKQIIISSIILCLAVLCAVGGTTLYYNHQMKLERQQQKEAAWKEDTDKVELNGTGEMEEVAEESKPEVQESVPVIKNISFSGTSIDKDLKIKIVDENNALVQGTVFEILVYPDGKEDKVKDYADENMNGIIQIKNMNGGDYVVKLRETEGFLIKENPIHVKVKEKIEYVKVDVKNEIKKEEEIDVKEEDAEAEREAVVENTVSPVVPEEKPLENALSLLESKIIPTEVKKENVSMTNFPAASVSENMKEESIGQTVFRLPESVALYAYGESVSKECGIQLEVVVNEQGLSQISELVNPETENPNNESSAVEIQRVEWSIDGSGIVNLTMDTDTEASVSAVQKGKAVISIVITYLDEAKIVQTKTLQSLVEVGDFTDDKTQLQDKDGNGLYLDGEATKIATLKDYGVTDTFYGQPKYTGWQTIDGKTYYFDENNQPVKGEQAIGFFHYKFDENGVLIHTTEQKGIDVSKWQQDIDWNAVANAGIDFAIIRVGYRGIKTGVMVEDPYFKANIAGATKAGIRVGVYFYSQALTEAEAVEEASMALELVKGYQLDYPIFIDTEGSGGVADKLSAEDRTKIVKAFCETVKNAGYKPGVYANKYWFEKKLFAEEFDSYMIWVAQYSSKCTYSGKYDMWQYTDSGTVNGVKWKVDLNICYKGF